MNKVLASAAVTGASSISYAAGKKKENRTARERRQEAAKRGWATRMTKVSKLIDRVRIRSSKGGDSLPFSKKEKAALADQVRKMQKKAEVPSEVRAVVNSALHEGVGKKTVARYVAGKVYGKTKPTSPKS